MERPDYDLTDEGKAILQALAWHGINPGDTVVNPTGSVGIFAALSFEGNAIWRAAILTADGPDVWVIETLRLADASQPPQRDKFADMDVSQPLPTPAHVTVYKLLMQWNIQHSSSDDLSDEINAGQVDGWTVAEICAPTAHTFGDGSPSLCRQIVYKRQQLPTAQESA